MSRTVKIECGISFRLREAGATSLWAVYGEFLSCHVGLSSLFHQP